MSRNQRRKLTRAKFSNTEELARTRYRSDVSHYPTKDDTSIRAQAHVAHCRMAGLDVTKLEN